MSTTKDKSRRHSKLPVEVETPIVLSKDGVKKKEKRASKKPAQTKQKRSSINAKLIASKELLQAIKEGNLKNINTLIEETPALKNAIVDPETQQNLLHFAIRQNANAEIISLLISLDVSPSVGDKKKKTPLHYLATVKDIKKDLIDALLQAKDLQVSAKDITGVTPLHLSIRFKNTLLTESLIALQEIEIDSEDINGLTPLHYACHEGQEKTVELLLKRKANAMARDKKGNTPLHYACDTGSLSIGRLLLAAGAEVEAENYSSETPLHRSITKNQESMCNWLVSSGADVIVRYDMKLYHERHKKATRKYLRQATREAKAAEVNLVEDLSGEDLGEDSDGEDLPNDPEGVINLQDKLDAYGFLIGSEKSNQLNAAEGIYSNSNSTNNTSKDSKESKESKRKSTKYKGDALSKADQSKRPENSEMYLKDPISTASAPSYEVLYERERKQKKLIKKWVKFTKLWNEAGPTQAHKAYPPEKIRKLIYKGIPNHVRAGVWRCISGTLETKLNHRGEYEKLLTHKITKAYSHQLDVDINRTNRTHSLFKERYGLGQISLFHILHAYCVYDPQVGYCQGMSDLTALMMMYIEEEETFWLLVRFMQDPLFKMSGRFETGFKDLKRAWYIHDKLLAEHLPRLHAYLASAELEAIHYTIKWYLKCFLDALTFDCVLRVWDVLLFEGSDVLYTFVITLMKYHEPEILKTSHDELLLKLPTIKGPPPHISVDSWLKDVKKNPIKPKIIRAYEAEFDAMWPEMQAKAKEEADRKQAEWQKRKKKMEEIEARKRAEAEEAQKAHEAKMAEEAQKAKEEEEIEQQSRQSEENSTEISSSQSEGSNEKIPNGILDNSIVTQR